jgi:hypothetical protein
MVQVVWMHKIAGNVSFPEPGRVVIKLAEQGIPHRNGLQAVVLDQYFGLVLDGGSPVPPLVESWHPNMQVQQGWMMWRLQYLPH